jgi:hypothetical protein
MISQTFIVPKEKNLELYRRLVGFYGLRGAKTKEENEHEIRLVYPTGVIGDIELHAYISKNRHSSKVIVIGEMPAINHTKIHLETLIGEKLQLEK